VVTNSITIEVDPEISLVELNGLLVSAWGSSDLKDISHLRDISFAYLCAYHHEMLVGFLNIVSDGNKHAFLLDTTVRKEYQRNGIGKRLVQTGLDVVRSSGLEWVHVDYEQHLESFYVSCGFRVSNAGVLNLKESRF